MGNTEIYIARHGETEYNRLNKIQGRGVDISLNEKGRLQAESIAGELRDVGLDTIFCSSLLRTRETAGIIAGTRGMDPRAYAELDEMNFGITEGRHSGEIGEYLDQAHRKWREGDVEYSIPGGESPTEVLRRAGTKADELLKEWEGGTMLFILHGRLIRILIAHWLGYGLEGMHKVEHRNGALYHLRWDGQHFEPVYLNKTSHLKIVT